MVDTVSEPLASALLRGVLPERKRKRLHAGIEELYLKGTVVHRVLLPETLAVANQLAMAFWSAGEIGQAVSLIEQVLDYVTCSFGREHPMRIAALSTLAEILHEQRHLEQASAIRREVLEYRIRHCGADDPDSLAAKGDMAAVLFELGENEEANSLEEEAFESARTHLGKIHPVTSVLAWNRALSCERLGDPDSTRKIMVDHLVWLLAEDPDSLDAEQRIVRSMLAEPLNWDVAGTC